MKIRQQKLFFHNTIIFIFPNLIHGQISQSTLTPPFKQQPTIPTNPNLKPPNPNPNIPPNHHNLPIPNNIPNIFGLMYNIFILISFYSIPIKIKCKC